MLPKTCFIIAVFALTWKLSANATEEKAVLLSTRGTAQHHRELSTKKGKKNKKDNKKDAKKTKKDAKKTKKDSKSDTEDYESLCNKRLFEGTFEYLNGCAKTTIASIFCGDDNGNADDTCVYSETLLDGKSSCVLNQEVDTEDNQDGKCSIGKLERFVGGSFPAKASIAYNERTGDCELSYTDLSTDPCRLYPKSLGVKASIKLYNENFPFPSSDGNSRNLMFLLFTDDYGKSYYNKDSPRIAMRTEERYGGRFGETYDKTIMDIIMNSQQNVSNKRKRKEHGVRLLEGNDAIIEAKRATGFVECEGVPAAEIVVKVKLDSYPAETEWSIQDPNGLTVAASQEYGWNMQFAEVNLTVTGLCIGVPYVFRIHDSNGDGICCDFGSGEYSVIHDGEVIFSGGQFEYSDETTFTLLQDGADVSYQSAAPSTSPTPTPCEGVADAEIVVKVKPDWYPSDIRWFLQNPNGLIVASRDYGYYTEPEVEVSENVTGLCRGVPYVFNMRDIRLGEYAVLYNGAVVFSGSKYRGSEVTTFTLLQDGAVISTPSTSPTYAPPTSTECASCIVGSGLWWPDIDAKKCRKDEFPNIAPEEYVDPPDPFVVDILVMPLLFRPSVEDCCAEFFVDMLKVYPNTDACVAASGAEEDASDDSENDVDEEDSDEDSDEIQPICQCGDCARQLQFIYTGSGCPENQPTCTDASLNPFMAEYRITNGLDATEVIAVGQALQGLDTITVDAISLNGCLPNTLAVTISVPTGAVTQTFTIDSSCDGGQGLIMVEHYGAFLAHDYSCN